MMHVEECYRSPLADARLTSVGAVMGLEGGTLVGAHPQRNVTRLALTGSDGPITLYLKRDWRRSPEEWLGAVLRGRCPHSRSYHEWRMLHAVRDAGFTCPEPVAVGERRTAGLPGESFLMVRELEGVEPMPRFLHALESGPASVRRAFVTWFGTQVGRFHAAGLWHTDLFSKHVLLGGGPDGWRWAMIDLQRADAGSTTPDHARWRDLATLDATTPTQLASGTDRLRFLHAYLAASGAAGDWKRVARGVRSVSAALGRHRKVQEMRRWDVSAPAAPEVVLLDDGRIRARADYASALERAGLAALDGVMTTRGTEFLRHVADRANLRVQLEPDDGPPVNAFLKRHVTRHVWDWVRAGFSCRGLLGPGPVEAHNVRRLDMAGVPTMTVIAYGQRVRRPWHVESFVLVEPLADAVPLDDHLRDRFEAPCAGPTDARRRQLVRGVAALVRRFHAAGFNHRDLYCCHVFVRAPADGDVIDVEPALYLIDLQRVQRHRWRRRRWRVKDLAQLAYSVPAERVSRTDRMRFFREYLGVGKLRAEHKRLARSVWAKVRRMDRRGQGS